MRLTYRSAWGDYGCAVEYDNDWEEKNAFRNALGKFEDAFQWNSVDKFGLPKEEGSYYVTARDSLGAMDDIVALDEFHNGRFWLGKVDYKVVAWMPVYIPEPYIGE